MNTPEKQATLLFLIKDNLILLAMKKRGFGKGRFNGVGGKPEGDETIEETAIRECYEEINVTPTKFKQVAHMNFYFPADKPDWDQQVFVYFCTEWQGQPTETEEMRPEWFKIDSIPYDEMWSDDRHWLPELLNGNFVDASFSFGDNDEILRQEIATRPRL